MLHEMKSREQPTIEGSIVGKGQRTEAWEYQDLARCRTLWLDCLLYGQLGRSTKYPDIYLHILAESAFAAAWAALEFWEADKDHKKKLERILFDTSNFLETLKPERHRPGIPELHTRLRRVVGQGESRTEIWAYVIGHWLHEVCDVERSSHLQELTELGWPLASFGLSFWSKDPVWYRKDGKCHRLVQPFPKSHAFELYGPFKSFEEHRQNPTGESLVFGSLVETRGLRSPLIWKLEGLLGAVPGARLTRTGHVHRQFAASDLPEWFEAVEVVYQPEGLNLESILHRFWEAFDSGGDLVFYRTESQKQRCLVAWEMFQEGRPNWAVPNPLELRPCKWFEPAKRADQKLAFQSLPVLKSTFAKLDLTNSHLATKLNSFASGFGQDEDVVLLAARYGLDDGLTLALRTVRYFARHLNQQ